MREGKERLFFLIENAEEISKNIREDVKDVVAGDRGKAFKVAVGLMLFVNNIEAFYKKVIRLETGKNVKHVEIVEKLVEFSQSKEFLDAYCQLKISRNSVAHQIDFAEPMLKFFNGKINGLSHICETNKRMSVVIQNMKEDAYYL